MSRLSVDLHESLTSDVLRLLFNKSVFTCSSFVRTNSQLLVKISGLDYNEILQIKNAILNKFSSTLKNGNKVYGEFINQCSIIPTGIKNFDKLLDSGFMTGHIYELCGFAGSGKTQICMTIAANIALEGKQQVLYIDTKNDITAHKISDIIEHEKSARVGETMQRIKILQACSAHDLLQTLHNLLTLLKHSEEKYLGFKLIIVDSLSALFQRFLDHNEGLPLLNNVATLLKYICVEYHMAVLLINYVSSWSAETSEEVENEGSDQLGCLQVEQPALGKYWAHVPNSKIMVKKLDALNECFLILLKSPNQPIGKSVKIQITDFGAT